MRQADRWPGVRVVQSSSLGFVGGSTNRQGRWATSNSPLDEIYLEISRPGYATAHLCLAAREKEYVVTLWPPLRISGRVIDAVTKKPLPKFHIWADPVCPEHDVRPDLILAQA